MTKTRSQKAKASRDKGKRGELEVAHILTEHGFDGHRTQQYAGNTGTADVEGLPGIHIEVKRAECYRIKDWYKQSSQDSGDEEIPIVVFRSSKERWRVLLDFEDFLELLVAE